jgi:hypothetical protein
MSKKCLKSLEKARRKVLREKQEQQIPHYTEGYWEEAMLENNSYYDIDILEKYNNPIRKEIRNWEENYKNASSWIGKWYCQIRIDKLKKKLEHYED